jgi:hypothetical protein
VTDALPEYSWATETDDESGTAETNTAITTATMKSAIRPTSALANLDNASPAFLPPTHPAIMRPRPKGTPLGQTKGRLHPDRGTVLKPYIAGGMPDSARHAGFGHLRELVARRSRERFLKLPGLVA